jgi:hypothetical protein
MREVATEEDGVDLVSSAASEIHSVRDNGGLPCVNVTKI